MSVEFYKNKIMKVLLINNCHFRRGGADVVYLNTAELLQATGVEVVFFSYQDDANIKTDAPEYFLKRGGKLRQIRHYFCNPDAAKMVERIIDVEKPDIAHAHLIWGGISASIIEVLHNHKIPLVHTVHDYRMVCPAYTFRNGHGRICEKCKGGHFLECFKNRCSKGNAVISALMAAEMYYRNKKWHPAKCIDGLIYVSKFAKQKHIEIDDRFSQSRSTVLYNFTTVGEKFPPMKESEGYYLYYGRLSHEKGVKTLIDAFVQYPKLRLKVVGAGPLEDSLKQQEYSNIEFLGYKTGAELYNLVRRARFVCVPSEWYENNPMTIIEAYSMGVPVIGARIGGIPEIVDEGRTGFLFESGDVNSLIETIKKSQKFSEDDYSSLKKQAFIFANTHFEKEEYIKRLMEFYHTVIDNNKLQ